jgi:hypothetical protein
MLSDLCLSLLSGLDLSLEGVQMVNAGEGTLQKCAEAEASQDCTWWTRLNDQAV